MFYMYLVFTGFDYFCIKIGAFYETSFAFDLRINDQHLQKVDEMLYVSKLKAFAWEN